MHPPQIDHRRCGKELSFRSRITENNQGHGRSKTAGIE